MDRFSKWFDSLQEPKRFFMFAFIVFGSYIPLVIAMLLDAVFTGKEYHGLKVVLITFAICHIIFFIIFALYRAFKRNT